MRLNVVAVQLQQGQPITFRPAGHSMTGIINHRQQVTIAPVGDPQALRTGDVVLVKIRGAWLLHRIKKTAGNDLVIANARGHENGRVPRDRVAGVVTQIFTAT